MSTKNSTAEPTCAELQAEVEALRAEVETLRAKAQEGRAGYIVTTPNPKYSGMTAGVQFRAGRAFIPAGEKGEALARLLVSEFEYSVQRVDDWQAAPEGEAISKSMIDMLMLPDRR